jgi:hypothetical protein
MNLIICESQWAGYLPSNLFMVFFLTLNSPDYVGLKDNFSLIMNWNKYEGCGPGLVCVIELTFACSRCGKPR